VGFTGDNCEAAAAAAAAAGGGVSPLVVGAVLAVLIVLAIAIVLVMKRQRYAKSMMATNFFEQVQAMKQRGQVDEGNAMTGLPRELKRGWLALVDKLGHGAFGDVWKGLLKDGGGPASPEYMVACKVVKEASGSLDTAGFAAAEEELLKEALLMAQVDTHKNLVSLIGVVTRGKPKVLILSYCEHGELLGRLKRQCADGKPIDQPTKFRFCAEIATGMQHLCTHSLVHRDLAARNVLLASGMVCKVADFGLSRQVQTEHNASDYYRSSSGIVPVRWTAPEGLISQKFSSAADVWSFGITCVEIFQDGGRPYQAEGSNPAIIKLVTAGNMHPQPPACTPQVYAALV
jgi:serine/threonine protein kinase